MLLLRWRRDATRVTPRLAALRSACLALLCSLAGCRGCKNDHPYVPYTIEDPDASADATAAGEAGAQNAAPAAEVAATQAPPSSSRWTLDGVQLVAPASMVFELGVARDFDGDGKTDVAALVRHADTPNELGSLVYYRATDNGVAQPLTVAPSPAIAAADPRCVIKRRMSAVGQRSILLELGFACPVPSAREPSRRFAVWLVSGRGNPRLHFSADVVDPPGAPRLTLDVDAADRDNDGIEDVLLRVTAEGGDAPFEPLPRTEATLRYFDRPAGVSRDPDDPDGSLRAIAGTLAAKAAKAKEAPLVPAQARAVRVLYGALCSEGGAPRLLRVVGDAPMTCGTSRALEEAGLAEVRARATLGEALAALTAYERAQLPPATKTASRSRDAEAWIAQVAPSSPPTQLRAIAAVPLVDRTRAPSWGPLAFETTGKLLVRTAAGVVRVDPELGDENEARDVSPWGMPVLSPDGNQRFLEAYNACDGVALHATLSPTGDGDLTDVALPIAPRLGAKCATSKGSPAPVVALAWGAGGLEAIVAGEAVLIAPTGRASPLRAMLGQPVSHGSARSPDGKSFAIPTSMGILVQGAGASTKTRLLRGGELEGTYAEQRDCVVADDGAHVACVRAGRAWVATF